MKTLTLSLLILVVILSVFLFKTFSSLKEERKDREFKEKLEAQNYMAFKDSITKEYDKKLKAYIFTKDNYVVNKLSDLKKYNSALTAELKKVKKDLLAVIDTKIQANLGGILAANKLKIIDEKKNYYGLDFDSDYKDLGFEQHIIGTSRFYSIPDNVTKKWTLKPDTTIFTTNLTNIHITYGFDELDDKYHVFAYTKSDKVQVTDLTGGYFINKQIQKPLKVKRWGVGPYVGYGLNNYQDVNFGVSIGVAVHYSVFQW